MAHLAHTSNPYEKAAVPSLVTRREPRVAVARAATCMTCHSRGTCLSAGYSDDEVDRLDGMVFVRTRVLRGEHFLDARDSFKSIYAIRSGLFKTTISDRNGREQVTGFHMGGDLLGLDGLHGAGCATRATALEDGQVCVMPVASIEAAVMHLPTLRRQLHVAMAGEIARSHQMLVVLGTMNGEQRLAHFLLDMSRRFLRRGYSGFSFTLRMTRAEIGSYIGLTLETVSRLFSAFQRSGLVEVRQKQVCNLDLKRLDAILAADG